jgi:hypothetical protein
MRLFSIVGSRERTMRERLRIQIQLNFLDAVGSTLDVRRRERIDFFERVRFKA